ncbi:MAG TPA: hypothetical protein DCG47_11880 [Spirochaetaceae bacterium]|jgi:hypothetical protein|nr:hypothetical protein [Spirochaetaceae bacterium]
MDADSLKRWKDALIADKGDTLIAAARRWFGPIRTPFNKHELLSKVEAYLKRQDMRERVVQLLDAKDRRLLALFKREGALPSRLLLGFLAPGGKAALTAPSPARLKDLCDRMVLYSYSDDKHEFWYAISPPLEAAVLAALSDADLAPSLSLGDEQPGVDPLAGFCALASACAQAKPAFKSREALSKAAIVMLHKTAPWLLKDDESLKLYLDALRNAGALGDDENGRPALDPRAFLRLAEDLGEGLASLLIMSVAPAEPDIAALRSAILVELIRTLPAGAVLLAQDLRFLALAATMDRYRALHGGLEGQSMALWASELCEIPEQILLACLRFGIFIAMDDGRLALSGSADAMRRRPSERPALAVEESQEIRIVPEAGSLPRVFVACAMRLEDTGLMWTARLDKSAAMAAFAWGFSAATIADRLEAESGKSLPQSVRFSLHSWEEASKGAILRSGIILTLDDHYAALLENTPRAGSLLREKLREGVYLLDAPNLREAEKALNSLGIEVDLRLGGLGGQRDAPRYEAASLSAAYQRASRGIDDALPALTPAEASKRESADRSRAALVASLAASLGSLSLSADERAALLDRIRAGFILDASQLSAGDWSQEIVCASGLDYPAKLRIIERALREGHALDLGFSDTDASRSFIGWPLELKKLPSGLALSLRGANGELWEIAVKRIAKTRLIHTDLYGDYDGNDA